MSQDDWQTVVTRRELVAEQKVERKAQGHQTTVPKAERKLSWQSSNLAGDCVKRLHTDERAAAAGFQDDWSAKAVRRAELKKEDSERAQRDKAAEARRKRVRRIEDGKQGGWRCDAHALALAQRRDAARVDTSRAARGCYRRHAAQRKGGWHEAATADADIPSAAAGSKILGRHSQTSSLKRSASRPCFGLPAPTQGVTCYGSAGSRAVGRSRSSRARPPWMYQRALVSTGNF